MHPLNPFKPGTGRAVYALAAGIATLLVTTNAPAGETPYRGYLKAHNNVEQPLGILGGPLNIGLTQDQGGVFVVLPSQRKLDPYVFGTPDQPRAFGGTPGINGLPLKARGKEDGQYTRMKKKSPFGNKYVVLKNGEVVDGPRLLHGMLTEYVRKEGYELAFDDEVTPGRRHFHLMVPPMMPNPKRGNFKHDALKTGFELPNGKQLPFWHVMFENLEFEASHES